MAEENKSKGLLGGALELGGKVISTPFKLVGGALKLGGKAVDKVGRGILGNGIMDKVEAPFKDGVLKSGGKAIDKVGRGLLGDGIMDKAEAPFKFLGTVGKTIGNKLKTIPITMQLSALKSELMVMAIEFINSLKSTLDKNNRSVAKVKETAAKKGYSTEQTMAKIDEKTKDTKIFKENKGQNKTAGNMAKSNDVGKLLESTTPGTNGMALAGKDGLSKPDIGLNK